VSNWVLDRPEDACVHVSTPGAPTSYFENLKMCTHAPPAPHREDAARQESALHELDGVIPHLVVMAPYVGVRCRDYM
jgi:hypothetical protein